MKILSYNPGHDGAFAYLKDGCLMFSIEAEKNSKYRYSPVSCPDVFNSLGEIDDIPDIICTGGWWPFDHFEYINGSKVNVSYRGLSKNDIIADQRRLLGKSVHYFSSSHERSHILCAYGMSKLPKGTPCYALIWEGEIGTFYEIDSDLNITVVADVLNQVGNRYGLFYGIADPTFPKNGRYPRWPEGRLNLDRR
jgi:hydroxymethyl cephem carbamoyltransferase